MPSRSMRAIMTAAKAAASAPSSSSPPAPKISCRAPRASPPPGKVQSIAATPNGNTPCAIAVGRSIRRTRSRSVDRGSCDMFGETDCFSFVLLLTVCQPPAAALVEWNPEAYIIEPLRPAFQPSRQTSRGFGDVACRAGEREAHPAAAADRVEIEAGGDRDAGFSQQAPAEFLAVAGQFRNVDI